MHSHKRIYFFIILLLGLFSLSGLMMMSKYDSSEYDPSAYDAFLSIRLHAPLSTTFPDIKLYTDESGEGYFFLPSCASLSDYVFSLEKSQYEILIDGKPIHNRDSLEQYEVDTPYPVTLSTTGEITEHTITFMRSENLPAVFISTASGSIDALNISKGNKDSGNFVCITADGQIDSSGSLSSVKAHGNSSFTMVNKKSYQITFDNATDVLSMGTAGKYILQANAFDDTFLRNKIAYGYCKELGIAYAVDAEYVDLYFNGEYAGNYLLTEKVEIGKNRVDLTGGYLMEQLLSERIEADDQVFGVNGLHDFLIKNPSPLSEKELQSLSAYMNTVETMIQDCNSDEKYATLQEYIDIDSFVDMYLINAITNDIDSNIASTFYYKKEDADDQKLYAGPAWDYDNAWGRMDNKLGYELNAYPTGLCEELFSNDRFREAVTEKYNDVAYPLMQDYLTAKIPQYLEQIASSIAMDSARWQSDGYHSYYYTDYDAAVSYLKSYIGGRMDYLYSWLNHPEEYRRVLFVNAKSNHKYRDTEYMIKDGEQIPEEVFTEILSRFEGSDFQNEDGSPFSPETAILNDTILYVN